MESLLWNLDHGMYCSMTSDQSIDSYSDKPRVYYISFHHVSRSGIICGELCTVMAYLFL